MTEAARKYISNYCKKNSLTPAALEREGGIPRDAIYAFVTGKVTDLKLNTAISIADLLSISLDELVGREGFLEKFINENSIPLPINSTLINEVTNFVFSYIDHNNLRKYTLNEAMYAIGEVYEYCVSNKRKTIDKDFADYFCKNLMHLLR